MKFRWIRIFSCILFFGMPLTYLLVASIIATLCLVVIFQVSSYPCLTFISAFLGNIIPIGIVWRLYKRGFFIRDYIYNEALLVGKANLTTFFVVAGWLNTFELTLSLALLGIIFPMTLMVVIITKILRVSTIT